MALRIVPSSILELGNTTLAMRLATCLRTTTALQQVEQKLSWALVVVARGAEQKRALLPLPITERYIVDRR